jgi:acetyl-CoA carboxylase, biotin carboxylase subunit
MFSKILIANRGEIAVRIMRTAKEMGIKTVAVFSDVDKGALHVQTADEAVCLGDPDPGSSYLNAEKIIAAAKETGAEAIHPGYGFLAENSSFVEKVQAEGLVFIGPSAKAMAVLGDKIEARKLMEKAGIPLVPGMIVPPDDPEKLAEAAKSIGFPVLVKAAMGGGGKGMRVVADPDELAEATKMASGEAKSAFGDGTVFLEKYLVKPRHIEVQIMADSKGSVVHMFERECSIQRRYQKIIEETPSTALNDELRKKICSTAVSVAKAAGYVNAGTVEFLLDSTGEFYFLEVNTRLQVEHPITEMITGLDLVRCQINIAAGKPLEFSQNDITPRGHAIECRIYAEDPVGFLPSPGKVHLIQEPAGPGVRFDGGVYSGFEIPVYYDPIIGKLVVWAENREAAIDRMIRALGECVTLGVKTSIELMIDVLDSPAFRKGDTYTSFLDEHFASWGPSDSGDQDALLGFIIHDHLGTNNLGNLTTGEEKSFANTPWQTLGRWDLMG